MIKAIWTFISYWYFRYLMVTELYMVEWWEQVIINGGFLLLILLLAYFNYSVLLGMVSYLQLAPVVTTTAATS